MKNKKGYLLILMAGVLWGTIGFFVTLLDKVGASSSLIAIMRIGMCALILVPVLLFMGGTKYFKIDRKGLLICLILGILCQSLFNYSYNESIENVGVMTGAILLYTAPIFVSIMSKFVFKEAIGRKKLFALGINILGCILTVSNGDFSSLSFSPYGVIAGVLAGFLYALMTILSSTTTEKYHPFTILFYSFLFGSITLAILTRPWEGIALTSVGRFWCLAFLYGLIPTFGSYVLYMKGLSFDLEMSKVPVIASVETIVAAAIGILIFGESAGLVKFIGVALVIISIGIMNMKSPKGSNEV